MSKTPDPNTVVRKNGAKTAASALSADETVFAGGLVVNGTTRPA